MAFIVHQTRLELESKHVPPSVQTIQNDLVFTKLQPIYFVFVKFGEVFQFCTTISFGQWSLQDTLVSLHPSTHLTLR